jgi:hypothetical protein
MLETADRSPGRWASQAMAKSAIVQKTAKVFLDCFQNVTQLHLAK